MILITDGYDENSTMPIEEALASLKEAKATVYVVAIGGVAGISLKGEKVLRRIATETGGRVFMPTTEGQLELVHNALADDVQNRYLITYTPANQAHDGRWREISVVTGVPEYRVKARPGYFAPKPAPVRPSLEFTAIDLAGDYLDVSADDLEVYEDGVLQQVDTFLEASQPVSIVLALDASGSMRHQGSRCYRQRSRVYGRTYDRRTSSAVMLFSDSAEFTHDLSTNRDTTRDAIGTYKTSGGTALYDALGEAIVTFEARGRATCGRGHDRWSRREQPWHRPRQSAQVAGRARGCSNRAEPRCSPLRSARKSMRAMLQNLADLSGGRALMPQDVSTLERSFNALSKICGGAMSSATPRRTANATENGEPCKSA